MGRLINLMNSRLLLMFSLFVGICVPPGPSIAADVDVYAEGAYTATDLKINIYADINGQPILSFGVKVSYPAGLTFAGATKNETAWFFGNGIAEHPYVDPQDDGTGVVIIGGKLDTANPMAGVTGTKVLLGTVNFTHGGMTDFSGVSLTYGRGDGNGSFKNFVATNGIVYDGNGVGFTTTIRERGDANGDGTLNVLDYSALKYYLRNGGADHPWMNCNDDHVIDILDASCIKFKLSN